MALKNDWTDDDWFGSQDQNDIADEVNSTASTVVTHTSQIADKADKSRKVSAGTGLTGGGDLTADRTLSADFGSGAGKVCQGNDARLSDSRTPKAHTHDTDDIVSGQFAAARMPTGYCTGSVNMSATNTTIWRGTAAQYDAIESKDGNTIYFVKD